MSRSICFLAQFPPPVHGLSKAVDTLFNSPLKTKYYFSRIDITENKKIFSSIWKLLTTDAETIYFTNSQTIGGNWRDLVLLAVIRLRRLKCIMHLHGGFYRTMLDTQMSSIQRWLNKILVKRLNGVIVLGESLQWIFKDLISDNKIFIVKNCIDNQFCIDNINEKITKIINADKIHILYLSNFIASKGYPELLQVALTIKQRGLSDKFCFHFAGKFFDQKEEAFFRTFVDNNNLENLVILHGTTYGKEKLDLLEQCQIFSLLTSYPNEGQPISILEAMGNGMAVITTDHAGIPDIASVENGFVCTKSNIDVADVADYLVKMFADREALASICLNNYQVVRTEFTEDKYIASMDKVFEKVISHS